MSVLLTMLEKYIIFGKVWYSLLDNELHTIFLITNGQKQTLRVNECKLVSRRRVDYAQL